MKKDPNSCFKQKASCVPHTLYVDLYTDLVRDVADQFGVTHKESERDLLEITNRVRAEGLPFLTVVLPRMGKALDKALSHGTPLDLPFLAKRSGTNIPCLFGELFLRVFDSSGIELLDSSTCAVAALRQLAYFVYKLEIPHTKLQERELLEKFVAVDKELLKYVPMERSYISKSTPTDPDPVKDWKAFDINLALTHARNLTSSVFGQFDAADILPKHGPGAVATGELNHTKHVFKRLYSDIERVYPFTEYFMFNMSHVVDQPGYIQSLQVIKEGTAKVVLVPKDSRGPRIISCEPLEYQWIQQGLGNKIRVYLESHRLTTGHVNFTSQEVNRSLALSASVDQQWFTVDMKDASDRVSLGLVELLFSGVGNLLDALKATRSTATKLPNGNVVRLNKFAPMGSSLCFPVESFVFYALAVGAIVSRALLTRPGSFPRQHSDVYKRIVSEACQRVYVYGDDIILKPEDYGLVADTLHAVGLLVNAEKSCIAGFFRESCGMDAYKGVCVTPLRLKRLWCHRRVDPVIISSWVAFGNALERNGYHRTSDRIVRVVESVVGPLPVLPPREHYNPQSPTRSDHLEYGGWIWSRYGSSVRVQPKGVRLRFCPELHRLEVRTRQSVPVTIQVHSDDWCMVLRRFSSPSKLSEPGVYAVTHRSKTKWVWIPVAA